MTVRPESHLTSGLLGLAHARLAPHAVIAELGEVALNGLEAARLFELTVRLVCDALDVEYASILLRDGTTGQTRLGACWGWDDSDLVQGSVEDARSLVEFTLSVGEPVVVTEMPSERRFTPWPLLTDSSVFTAVSVTIPGQGGGFGVLGAYASHRRGFSADEVDFLRSLATIVGARMQSELEGESQRQRIRYQAALAECAQALLVGSGEDRLERAARALLSATDAESVFIERNVIHPEFGFCSQTVAEADRPGTPAAELEADYQYWDLTPWDRMPISRAHLEKGEPFILIPEQLKGVEYELYAADPFRTRSELDIPIFVNGEWVGLIAFSESAVARDWAEQDLSLLTAAAQMVGAFWEAQAASEQLRHLVESKDQLIASVSHELRTPLTSVVGFAKLLEMEGSDLTTEERAGVIRTIAEEGVDLANIIDDLLVAAKAESGTLAVVAVPIALQAQVAQVVEACRPEDASRISLSADATRAVGDPARVRQILRNLISNALRYGGDTIHVEVSTLANMAQVIVSDNGPGIAPEDQDRIFESYYRGTDDPGLAGSMGLGLTISRELARLMRGNISYRYEHGESTFELLLPRME